MKKASFLFVCVALLLVFGIGLGNAEKKATKDECMAKCKEAAALIKDIGSRRPWPKFRMRKDRLLERFLCLRARHGGEVPGASGCAESGRENINGP